MAEQEKLEYDFNLHSTAIMEYAKELTTKGLAVDEILGFLLMPVFQNELWFKDGCGSWSMLS
jgi:hypothetical protein